MNLQELTQLFELCRSYGITSFRHAELSFVFATPATVHEFTIPPPKEPDAVEKARRQAEEALFRAMSDEELLTAHLPVEGAAQ